MGQSEVKRHTKACHMCLTGAASLYIYLLIFDDDKISIMILGKKKTGHDYYLGNGSS